MKVTDEFREESAPTRGPGSEPAKRRIRLVRHGFASRPGFDTAVSSALLSAASDGASPETLRLHVPGPIVAFGKRDVISPGYPDAVAAARKAGFAAVERLAGGRAAVFHPGTVAFAWTIPDPDPRAGVTRRFREVSALIRDALAGLGVDALIGEIPGEYCPGEFSVNAGGAHKLMGVGQRLARRAAHVGGVIVVTGADRVRDVLVPVYEALRLDWDPATVGAVDEFAPGVTPHDMIAALIAEFATRHDLLPGDLDRDIITSAEPLASRHLAAERTDVAPAAGSLTE